MSNPDSFINEVTEELRRDRMVGYLRRYGWIAVLLVVLVVGGAAWNEWRKASDRASAQAFGDAVLTALENDDSAGRIQALAQIDATGAQQGVINLLSAGELFETDRAAALAALRAASEDDAVTDSYRQLAALKYVIAGGDDVPLAERETILAGLAQPGRPFRPLALEQTALLQLEQGNPERTIEILADLLSQSDVSDALERRATQLIIALGGDPAAN